MSIGDNEISGKLNPQEELLQLEKDLIKETKASPLFSQRLKKAAAVFATALAGIAECALDAIWTVGGLREPFEPKKKFIPFLDVWNSRPLSPASAQKVHEILTTLAKYQNSKPDLTQDLLKNVVKYQFITADNLTSIYSNRGALLKSSSQKEEFFEAVKKLEFHLDSQISMGG